MYFLLPQPLAQYFVDGGLLRHIPQMPPDAGATYVAGISCVPFKFLENLPGVQRLKLLRALSVSPDMVRGMLWMVSLNDTAEE